MYRKMRQGMKLAAHAASAGHLHSLLHKLLAQTLPNYIVLHTTNYLLDETGLIAVRGKQITLRPLDKVKLAEQRRRSTSARRCCCWGYWGPCGRDGASGGTRGLRAN